MQDGIGPRGRKNQASTAQVDVEIRGRRKETQMIGERSDMLFITGLQ